MAKQIHGKLEDLLAAFGPPDAMTPLHKIPDSHKADWHGADFACPHIASKGSQAGGDGYWERTFKGYGVVVLCEECNKPFAKGAGAGK